jgi:hypothetical protein
VSSPCKIATKLSDDLPTYSVHRQRDSICLHARGQIPSGWAVSCPGVAVALCSWWCLNWILAAQPSVSCTQCHAWACWKIVTLWHIAFMFLCWCGKVFVPWGSCYYLQRANLLPYQFLGAYMKLNVCLWSCLSTTVALAVMLWLWPQARSMKAIETMLRPTTNINLSTSRSWFWQVSFF